ncbi:assimilatory sulfite reductase (NADPH) flavoprotein subunit [Shewanella sp. NIFS-20-20]|uniref:assimilatory sulfite reductase (NADPH) flavoprotein subunit n=1 Tax=Shewanella sp. NIFS-20-20 TaxID=2853806 RepID=UPI001C459849|nr:assimilatory sulfite reductase (NADPH) flavoprotein subunit [Shewanella sp. NIFS-20-20]MBV7314669.1 assimilatory sulfite reductase (NADPH) flavoprotein subunit [Shewanella sp. NIFS-20-20]
MLLTEKDLPTPLLSEKQREQVSQLTAQLSPLQQAWLSGYLAASCQQAPATTEPGAVGVERPQLTLLYGSQTGNGRGVATELAAAIREQGIDVSLVSMADYSVRQLKNEHWLVVVVSTHGEGEAPDDAIELHQYLASKRAPKLEKLNYGVIALGDSSYEFFCQTGKDFDERLQALGAKPIMARLDCDLDYHNDIRRWQDGLLEQLAALAHDSTAPSQGSRTPMAAIAAGYSKQQPYQAELLLNQKITGRHSSKDIRHIEIDLGESGISYQAGDALGVWFNNAPELVDEIVALTGLKADDTVVIDGQSLPLATALLQHKELTQLTPATIHYLAELSHAAELMALTTDKQQMRAFILSHQLADVLVRYQVQPSAQGLVDALRNITPRLYSIASSQAEVESEVHLTVGVVADEREGKLRFGGASHFLASGIHGQAINVYVEPNHNFRLPADDHTKIIMVGPGTGIAPFRAFLQERANAGCTDTAWLFFGNPHFEQDFLYQTEWQSYLKSGVLARLDAAFSRDQADKIYVQHRLLEQGEQVWQWLQQGAHFYVCGDEKRMAKDVHQALLTLVERHGGLSAEQAQQYVDNLRSQKRYQKDVY